MIRSLSGIENFVSERDYFIFNSFRNFNPVKRIQNKSEVLEFWSMSKSILDVLDGYSGIPWRMKCMDMLHCAPVKLRPGKL